MQRILIGLAGMALILLIAFAFSSNRKAIRLRVVSAAFALQAAIAVLVLYVDAGKAAIQAMSHGVQAAAHAVRGGDSHGGGSSVNLSESDR
jgi:CNT family concentrative nucleoside transporter